MESSILFESTDKSVVVVDIPRSIEEAQELPGRLGGSRSRRRRLILAAPVEKPWATPEPRRETAGAGVGVSAAAAIAELMTLETVRSALDRARSEYGGPWCLPRVLRQQGADADAEADVVVGDADDHAGRKGDGANARKRKQALEESGNSAPGDTFSSLTPPTAAENVGTGTSAHSQSPQSSPHFFIPEKSHPLHGTIAAQRATFLRDAPPFELVVLDPPWPSRSARRKRGPGGYGTARDMDGVRDLLRGIPVGARLAPSGLVAVWVTNKAAVADLLLGSSAVSSSNGRDGEGRRREEGLFAEWGLEPVAEWIWLKITATGEPVVGLEAQWRKPWERLLIARKKEQKEETTSVAPAVAPAAATAATEPNPAQRAQPRVQTKVLLAVPDVHSRKPNLRRLFADVLRGGQADGGGEGRSEGEQRESYAGLEVFSRNLTAGWWSWGDEVLCFQHRRHWVVSTGEEGGGENDTEGARPASIPSPPDRDMVVDQKNVV